jgi:hypothetical protein
MKTIYSIVKNPKYNCITRFSFRERQKHPMKPVNYFCSLINMWAKRALLVPATHHSSRTCPLITMRMVSGESKKGREKKGPYTESRTLEVNILERLGQANSAKDD